MAAKKLGFGLMRLPVLDAKDPSSVDKEQFKQMVDLFLERGFTYFDTAWAYHGGNSERAVRECLVERHPRDSFTLATKMHTLYFNNAEEREQVFLTQMEKTGVSFFDYYLLHNVTRDSILKFEQTDSFEWLLEKKRSGLAREVGFSFHDHAELLDRILTQHPEIDFVQLQLNYLDWESEWIQSGANYEVCRKHGKPVTVMEPVKGGTLAQVSEKAREALAKIDDAASPAVMALRFAASLENVRTVLSGSSSLEQLTQNTAAFENFRPFNEGEMKAVLGVADIIRSDIAVPCTGCSYCTEGCPMNIAIPQYFSLYNADMLEARDKGWTPNGNFYRFLSSDHGKAGDCIQCGQCERECPQHLTIIEYLKEVARKYE